MNFRNISAWCIRNPVVPLVLFAALVLLGVVSFMQMKVQQDPDIEFPMVIVTITQPGAAPTEIETQITQRVESAVRTIAGVQSISSTASEGSSQTMIEFQIGEDINAAVNEVKNQLDQIRGDLPDGILEPSVFKANTSSDPIAYFAVSAEDMSLEQLSWYVDDTIAKRLLAIEGMAAVSRNGGVSREILVTLDPARMQSAGVTAGQVNLALRQLNTNAAGGRAEIAGSRQSVRVLGNAANAFELSQTDIALGGGRTIKLADIADVRDSFGEITSVGKINGKQVVTFGITRARGASDVSVYDASVEAMRELEKASPGIHFAPLFNTVDYTKQQYESSMSSMVEGAILAVIVVFFFLRDWRATVISAIAIPLSAVPTFWFMHLLGFTLNQLSLLALGLVAGVLVDDAIVEIENIVRHMRMGKTAYQASIDAADEIGLAVVATTFSIVAVFLPVGLMPGVSGQFFKNFGLTVVVSVLMSLAVARMITPMIAAYFLKAHGESEHAGGRWMDSYLSVLRWSLDTRQAEAMRAGFAPVNATGAFLIRGALSLLAMLGALIGGSYGAYKGLLASGLTDQIALFGALIAGGALLLTVRWLLARVTEQVGGRYAAWYAFMGDCLKARLRDHRVWMIGVAAGALALTVAMFMVIPGQFFPNTNEDYARVQIEMVPGTTLAQSVAVSGEVAAILRAQHEVEAVLERINEGSARNFAVLRKDRDKTSMEFERALTPVLQKIPDARVSFQSLNGGGGGGGSGRPISIMLTGSDSRLLEDTATRVVEQMKGLKEVVAPRVSADLRRPEVEIRPRHELAASLGVATQALSQAIRIATMGEIDQNTAKFSLADRQVPIRVQLPEEARRNFSNIENLPVPTASGGSVPLSRVAYISFGSGPTSVQRYNQQRRVFIGADLAPGVVKSEAVTAIDALPAMRNLPQGVSNTAFGEDRWQAEMLVNVIYAVVAGIMLVFSVLVLLYRRFISPLVNMSSLFLAPLGGLLLLAFVGQPISMPVMIGILMLLGIVAKNSILLIDFAIEEMAAGRDKFEAIMDAGHKRAVPIVMTTVAMTAGMIPTAISLGGDGAWRAPMGTVVIGGLILSTALTLLIVPAAFSLADGLEKRLGPLMRRRFLTFKPEDARNAHAPQHGPDALPAE